MSNFVSVVFKYDNKGTKVSDDELLSMDAVFLTCGDGENGIEFDIEYIEYEGDNYYSIEVLIEDCLFNGIGETLNKPTSVILSLGGEEVKVNSDNFKISEIVKLSED